MSQVLPSASHQPTTTHTQRTVTNNKNKNRSTGELWVPRPSFAFCISAPPPPPCRVLCTESQGKKRYWNLSSRAVSHSRGMCHARRHVHLIQHSLSPAVRLFAYPFHKSVTLLSMINYSHRLPIDAFDGRGAFFSCNSLVPGGGKGARSQEYGSRIPESLWSQRKNTPTRPLTRPEAHITTSSLQKLHPMNLTCKSRQMRE